MRTKAFLMAAAVLAASGGIAEAQVRPGQDVRPGQYGGGFIEYLFAGGTSAGRRAAPQALRDDGTLPRHPAAYGYGGPGSPRPASAADPMARYRLEPGAAATRVAALPEQRYSNPYEDADPIAWAPEPGPARTSPAYRAAAPVARAPDPQFARQTVAFEGAQRAGTIVIDTRSRYLYLVQPGHSAIRYGIGVGRPGFLWHGVKTVSAKKEWPDWTPPKEMLARRPDLPTFMAGGVENPLGARALYLGSSLYRIHGTNEPHTIGQAVSSGCIRMMNEDVIDLYARTPVGARVEVI